MAYRVVKPSSLPSLAARQPDELLTIEEASAYLGFSPSTLEKWRSGYRGTRGGPPWIPMHDGERSPVRYMVKDIREWLDSQRINPSEGTETPAQVA